MSSCYECPKNVPLFVFLCIHYFQISIFLRICVLGRRDRNGQRLTFGHIQFTMPGSPSRPILKIDKLGDREVSLFLIMLLSDKMIPKFCF